MALLRLKHLDPASGMDLPSPHSLTPIAAPELQGLTAPFIRLVVTGQLIRMRRDACPPAFLAWVDKQDLVPEEARKAPRCDAIGRRRAGQVLAHAWAQKRGVTLAWVNECLGCDPCDAQQVYDLCRAILYHFQSHARMDMQVGQFKRLMKDSRGTCEELLVKSGSRYLTLRANGLSTQIRVADHPSEDAEAMETVDLSLDPGSHGLAAGLRHVVLALNLPSPAWLKPMQRSTSATMVQLFIVHLQRLMKDVGGTCSEQVLESGTRVLTLRVRHRSVTVQASALPASASEAAAMPVDVALNPTPEGLVDAIEYVCIYLCIPVPTWAEAAALQNAAEGL